MLTYDDLILRYPAMANMTPQQFAILQSDSVLIMGKDDGRWGTDEYDVYDPAQAALIAHYYVTVGSLTAGDPAIPVGPITRTDVDDVQIEFADRIWDNVPYQEADLYGTAYGQTYVRYRRMFFAGPRIA
ncbi:MAG: hypothetical protein [Caudoviricetes sp.]|nr:MAG: hypothetical protein [Caudoviricetes sp.]